ncbi:MAG: CAP domain-containing protein [Phycisphaerales bacterium]|nr:MAG: CAP domain-containing protein [Phycisphaerales bacterium]
MISRVNRRRPALPVIAIVAVPVVLMTGGCGTRLFSIAQQVLGGLHPIESGVPDNEYRAEVSSWNSISAQYEDEVILLINQHRAGGASCGSEGEFAPAGPLTANDALRCAARKHSLDMSVNGFFDHDNLDGEGPDERIAEAGYAGSTWGENIAYGSLSPAQVVEGWMNSPGHCANIMYPDFTEIGVGHYSPTNHWTTTFGAE